MSNFQETHWRFKQQQQLIPLKCVLLVFSSLQLVELEINILFEWYFDNFNTWKARFGTFPVDASILVHWVSSLVRSSAFPLWYFSSSSQFLCSSSAVFRQFLCTSSAVPQRFLAVPQQFLCGTLAVLQGSSAVPQQFINTSQQLFCSSQQFFGSSSAVPCSFSVVPQQLFGSFSVVPLCSRLISLWRSVSECCCVS